MITFNDCELDGTKKIYYNSFPEIRFSAFIIKSKVKLHWNQFKL